MSAILAEGVKPTLAELERFEEQPEGNSFYNCIPNQIFYSKTNKNNFPKKLIYLLKIKFLLYA